MISVCFVGLFCVFMGIKSSKIKFPNLVLWVSNEIGGEMWALDWGPPLTNQRPGQGATDQLEARTWPLPCLCCGEREGGWTADRQIKAGLKIGE